MIEVVGVLHPPVVQESLDDLRLVVDTLRHGDGEIASAIADYRYRCERRLRGHRSRVTWALALGVAHPQTDQSFVGQTIVVVELTGRPRQIGAGGSSTAARSFRPQATPR